MLVAIIKWNMQIDYFRILCLNVLSYIFIHVSMFSPFFNFFLFPPPPRT